MTTTEIELAINQQRAAPLPTSQLSFLAQAAAAFKPAKPSKEERDYYRLMDQLRPGETGQDSGYYRKTPRTNQPRNPQP